MKIAMHLREAGEWTCKEHYTLYMKRWNKMYMHMIPNLWAIWLLCPHIWKCC